MQYCEPKQQQKHLPREHPGHPSPCRFDPDNYEGSRIIGMPASDEQFPAPAPVGGSGAHSRGARSRAPGAAIGPLVAGLLTPGAGKGTGGGQEEIGGGYGNVQMSAANASII